MFDSRWAFCAFSPSPTIDSLQTPAVLIKSASVVIKFSRDGDNPANIALSPSFGVLIIIVIRLEYSTNMKQLLATLMVFAVAGCGSNLTQQGGHMDSFPVINPDDPASIAAWESSPYNFANAKISIAELRFFHGFLGDSTPKDAKSVALQAYEAKTNGITPEQQSAIDSFIQNERAIHSAIRDAIYEYYKESYPAYKEGLSLGAAMFGGADEIKDILPEISSGNELDRLVQFGTIYIHPPISGSASIGIDFIVPWDEEHGIGLRLQNGKVQAIGTGHEAFPVPQR